jgi:hypothetical protein
MQSRLSGPFKDRSQFPERDPLEAARGKTHDPIWALGEQQIEHLVAMIDAKVIHGIDDDGDLHALGLDFMDAIVHPSPQFIQGQKSTHLHEQVWRNPKIQAPGPFPGGRETSHAGPDGLSHRISAAQESTGEEESLDEGLERNTLAAPKGLQGVRNGLSDLGGFSAHPGRIQTPFKVSVAVNARWKQCRHAMLDYSS